MYFGGKLKAYTKKWDGKVEVDSHALINSSYNRNALAEIQKV